MGTWSTGPGGPNNNIFDGDDSAEFADGGIDHDFLLGGGGADTLYGGDDGDTITANLFDPALTPDGAVDVLNGGSGDDSLYGSFEDIFIGGTGRDAAYLNFGSATIIDLRGFSVTGGVISGALSGGGSLSEIEVIEIWRYDSSNQPITSPVTFYGSEGSDVVVLFDGSGHRLEGNGGDDTLIGSGTLLGGAGSDSLRGSIGNDVLDGGAGIDVMDGGAGNDTYRVDNSGDVIFELSGVDTIETVLSTYTLAADLENLTSIGFGFFQGTGNALDNTIIGSGLSDTIDGGGGVDTFRMNYSGYSVGGPVPIIASTSSVAAGFVTVATLTNIERLSVVSGSGADSLTGGAYGDSFKSAAGNDTLDGGAGADSMNGGLGDDTYYVDNSGDLVIEASGEGSDRVYASIDYYLSDNVERLTLTGSSNFSVNGNAQANLLEGNSGNNTLRTFGGADTLIGGDGNDTYVINETGVTITEALNEGTDSVLSTVSVTLGANVENLTLRGTAAINGTGNALANAITGNAAINTLTGGGGLDTLIGGAGNDIYYFDNAGVTVTENSGEGTDVIRTGLATYDLSAAANVENLLYTGGSAFTGTGNTLANSLKSGVGADTLDGGAGVDTMNGGAGDDVYYADNAGDVVIEASGGGSDRVYASVDYYLSDNVERLTLTGSANVSANGTAQANLLEGNSGNNILRTFGGADTLIGGDGNDIYVINETGGTITEALNEGTDSVLSTVATTLSANVENLTLRGTADIKGIGNDLNNVIIGNAGGNGLRGELGDDTLDGGAGNDVLKGGLGVDVLTGGVGADVFVFDAALGGGNLDTITDFNVVDDTIWLSGSIFTSLSLGALSANNFRVGAVAADTNDYILYQYSTGALFYDADGDGAGAKIQIASLTPQLSLSAQDFVVI